MLSTNLPCIKLYHDEECHDEEWHVASHPHPWGDQLSQLTTSVQNKQPSAPNASNQNNQSHADRSQEIQQPQTNANKTFSSQRLECLATSLLHHGPENRIQKTSRNMAAIKGPRLCKYTFVRFDSVTSVFVCVPFVELVLRVSCKETRFYFCTPLVRFGFVFEFYFLKKTNCLQNKPFFPSNASWLRPGRSTRCDVSIFIEGGLQKLNWHRTSTETK